jgi:hypothetical protein
MAVFVVGTKDLFLYTKTIAVYVTEFVRADNKEEEHVIREAGTLL